MGLRERLAEKVAAEICLSREPGHTIRKWREAFQLSQTDLAGMMRVSPSVISDYESGRRKSPGTTTVQRITYALLDLDERRGGRVMRSFAGLMDSDEAILDIRELFVPVKGSKFAEAIEGKVVANDEQMDRELKGYTIIDSVKAITSLSAFDYAKIYGWSSERALIFTGISSGRSPMVAVRVHPMKPSMIVYHRPEKVDDLALRLAKTEGVPLVVTKLPLDKLMANLKEL
ncbi:MAG TPA: helix-turn-helix domain-containing protein [Candidatus Thermoplasmatota archaeon]|nr:helix-turn-helix domain-containing protein [Candidatus Thermoplasmatota archaeon]